MFFICNKCHVTVENGKKPFSLMQCGHIFCYECIDEAQSQCPQCKCTQVSIVPIKDPLPHSIQAIFSPPQNHVEILIKTMNFQAAQEEILTQRFKELYKKYEALKIRYSQCMNFNKSLTKAIEELKEGRKKDKRRLVSIETHYRNLISPSTSTSSVFKTPASVQRRDYLLRVNQNINFSPRNSYGDVTPVKDNQSVGQRFSGSDVPSVTRLALNTPQSHTKTVFPYSNFIRR